MYGVQEAVSSTLATRTKTPAFYRLAFFVVEQNYMCPTKKQPYLKAGLLLIYKPANFDTSFCKFFTSEVSIMSGNFSVNVDNTN